MTTIEQPAPLAARPCNVLLERNGKEKNVAKMMWALEDHLCKRCGGRILRCVSGASMTPGGNPVFRCADCGASTAAMGPEELCWCGFAHKHNHNATAYRCVPFSVLKDRPELASAFGACGCDPKRGGEVGIMLERDLRSNDRVERPGAASGDRSARTTGCAANSTNNERTEK